MKRRLFNILASVSLVLCLATAGVWVWSYWAGAWQISEGRRASFLAHGIVHLRIQRSVPPATLRREPHRFLGFAYWRDDLILDLDSGAVLFFDFDYVEVPLWFPCAITAILPALWRYRRGRRLRSDGMPHCAKCAYNLTGNVSGICPECGTPIPGDIIGRGASTGSVGGSCGRPRQP